MMLLRLRILSLYLVALLCVQCSCFNVRHHTIRPTGSSTRMKTPSSQLFGSKQLSRSSLLMTDDSANDQEGTESKEAELVNDDDDDSSDEKWSLVRTIFLTVPLFCKFVVVLLIKFATDLIVVPALFLYRLAGVGKRKFLGLFREGPENLDKVNGAE